MDLTPFTHINPCGYAGLAMTQCTDQQGPTTVEAASPLLLAELTRELGYSTWIEPIESK